MTTTIGTLGGKSGLGAAPGSLAALADRWIYVVTALGFILIVLTGFIPDSVGKVAAVQAGQRPPFPLVLHLHAVLMGSFLLLLLAQTTLVALDRRDLHRRLGLAATVLGPALVVVGVMLVPVGYHSLQHAMQAAVGPAQAKLAGRLGELDNILLFQLRIAVLFPLFLVVGLRARATDPDLHKRMMIMAPAMALPAGINRIEWLPTTLPHSPLSTDLYLLLALSPLLVWDLVRHRRIQKAYLVALAAGLPLSVALYALWDSASWHAIARRILGA
ncbi:MAG: hypothetical protein JF588_23495 [Caulobacterales bacterium]|nr:hypothetical protein [Caulobacterales bacterium]